MDAEANRSNSKSPPPTFTILEKSPVEALTDLIGYVGELKGQPLTAKLVNNLTLANIMADEICKQHDIRLDFSLTKYVVIDRKKVSLKSSERIFYNFDRAFETVFRLRTREILKLKESDNIIELTNIEIEEIQSHVNTLREAIQTSSLSKNHKDRLLRKIERVQGEIHKTRSGYEKIISTATETVDALDEIAEKSPRIIDALERIKRLIFGHTGSRKSLPSPPAQLPAPSSDNTVDTDQQ